MADGGRQTMDFFQSQDDALRRTSLLVTLFFVAIAIIVLALYFSVAAILHFQFGQPLWNLRLFGYIAGGTLLVIIGGTLAKIIELRQGGSAVAMMLGGVPVALDSKDPNERKLLNVVEEMSLASGCPLPSIFVLPRESSINAFAAGFSQTDAAVAVTRGALEHLNRDELQGVIAHEFSHIVNGDMRLNIRLIGLLHGILLIGLAGLGLLRAVFSGVVAGSSHHSRRSNREGAGGGPIIIAVIAVGVVLTVAGYIGVFFGKIIKSAVSRQREYLADAAAVQYTRNPEGLSGALRKIGGLSTGAIITNRHAEEASHMFFGEALTVSAYLATHPPLQKRILAIDPAWDGTFPTIQAVEMCLQRYMKDRDTRSAVKKKPKVAPVPGIPEGIPAPQAAVIGAAALGDFQRTRPPGAREAVESIGQITPENLEYAGAVLREIPEELRQWTYQTQYVTSLVLALVISGESKGREDERVFLRQHATERLLSQVEQCLELLAPLDGRVRLPLIELSIPALRLLSDAEKEAFLTVLDGLIESDGSVTLFEFAIQRIIAASIYSTPKAGPQYYSLRPLQREITLLLSAVAYSGNADQKGAQRAFQRGASRLKIFGKMEIYPARECGMRQAGEALDKLGLATPAVKKHMLTIFAEAILADSKVLISEAEMLRAISAALDCPMPPLMGGA